MELEVLCLLPIPIPASKLDQTRELCSSLSVFSPSHAIFSPSPHLYVQHQRGRPLPALEALAAGQWATDYHSLNSILGNVCTGGLHSPARSVPAFLWEGPGLLDPHFQGGSCGESLQGRRIVTSSLDRWTPRHSSYILSPEWETQTLHLNLFPRRRLTCTSNPLFLFWTLHW